MTIFSSTHLVSFWVDEIIGSFGANEQSALEQGGMVIDVVVQAFDDVT